MPHAPRPSPFQYPEDAHRHVQLAVEQYTKIFGSPPEGVWPAEGSISPEVMKIFEQHEIEWTLSDEANLWRSLEHSEHDRGQLYQPFGLEDGRLTVFFRDRDLSDAVGFRYARMSAEQAVLSFTNQVVDSVSNAGDRPLVVVALDGENPWEYYQNDGFEFLEELYTTLLAHEQIETVTLRDAAKNNEKTNLKTIATGSWIDGDFSVWIGSPTENKAWNLLRDVRAVFATKSHSLSPESRVATERLIMRAQSSDWFWWYGDRFESADDGDFDRMFRGLIGRAYTCMDSPIPAEVYRPLANAQSANTHTAPKQALNPDFSLQPSRKIDWYDAGVVYPKTGSMASGNEQFECLRFGFDSRRLFFRFESKNDLSADPIVHLEITIDGHKER